MRFDKVTWQVNEIMPGLIIAVVGLAGVLAMLIMWMVTG